MPRATTPATVAATAATAGTVRVRCRAASRAAYRGESGSRPASFATPTTTTGARRIMPSTATTADAAIANSPLELDVAPYADPAMPMPTSTRPTMGERNDGRLSARRPASTATTSCRDAIHAGTTVASTALARPKSAIPARCTQGTSNGPNVASDQCWTIGTATAPATMPSTTPARAAVVPRTTPPPTTTRRL